MKQVGVVLLFLGLLGGGVAYSFDPSIETSWGRVNNFGLMEERRNYLAASGLAVLVGVILIGFGSINSTDNHGRACPHCAEKIRAEARVCRYCNRDIGEALETTSAALPKKPEVANCWHCAHYECSAWIDHTRGFCSRHQRKTFASDVCDTFESKCLPASKSGNA